MEMHEHDAHVHDRLTGLSLFLGMTIWFLDLIALNGLTSLSCEWGWFSVSIAGMPGLRFAQMTITLVAVLLMLVLVYLPWRNWRWFMSERPTRGDHTLRETERDRRPMMALVTVLLNGLFLLFVIAQFVPMFVLNACSRG